jgi:hypothetical protein
VVPVRFKIVHGYLSLPPSVISLTNAGTRR